MEKTKKKKISKKQTQVVDVQAPPPPKFFGKQFQGAWGVHMYESVPGKSLWGATGLKAHRGAPGKHPEHHCSNCRCHRYVACRCTMKSSVVPA